MRSLFFLFVLSCAVSFVGCDDDDVNMDTDIRGTWEAFFFEFETEVTTDFNGQITNSTAEIGGVNVDYRLTFNDDTFTTEGEYSITTTTTVPPNPPFATISTFTDLQDTGTYTLNGDSITTSRALFRLETNGSPVNLDEEEQRFTYLINANGELVLSQDQSFITNQSGANSTTIIRSTSVWRRQ